jgi:hypothetical protein
MTVDKKQVCHVVYINASSIDIISNVTSIKCLSIVVVS